MQKTSSTESNKIMQSSLFSIFLFSIVFLLTPSLLWAQSSPAPATEDLALAEFMAQVPLRMVDDREVAELTLQQVLSLALQRSLILDASQREEAKARHALLATQERNGAILTSSIENARNLSPSGTFPDLRVSRSNAMNLTSTFSKQLETGVKYGVTYAETRSQSTTMSLANEGSVPEVGATSDWLDRSSLTAFVDVPLFQDWGSELNNIPVRLSEIGVTRTQSSTLQSKISLLNQIASTYWRLVGIVEGIRVQKEEVMLSEKLVKENQLRHKIGLLTAVDVRVSEVQLARERQTLQKLRVDALQVEDQVRAALNLEHIKTGLYPVDTPKVQKLNLVETQLLKRVYVHDSSMSSLKLALKQAQFELQQEENKGDTNLDLALRYGVNSYQNNAFAGAANYGHPDLQGYSAKLTWTLPLSDKVTPEKIQLKQKEKERVQLSIANRESELKTILRSALRTLELSKQDVDTALLMLQLSEEQWKQAVGRFRVGKISSFQLAQTKQELALIRQQEIQARVTYETKLLEILLITGDIFDHYNLPR